MALGRLHELVSPFQALLLNLTTEFLQGMEQPSLLSPQLRVQEGVQAYVLDGGQARRWRQRIPEP